VVDILLEHGGQQATLTQVVGMLGGLEVCMQDLHLVADLAQLFIGVAIALNVSAEPPVVEAVDCITEGPIGRFMGKEVATPQGHWFDQVSSLLGNLGSGVEVGDVGTAIGSIKITVLGHSSCIEPLDLLGRVILYIPRPTGMSKSMMLLLYSNPRGLTNPLVSSLTLCSNGLM
jgi:hypothetical protein